MSVPQVIPESIRWLGQSADGAAWLRRLPTLLVEIAECWGLHDIGDAYPLSNVSFVAPARQGGRTVVLKVQWPHPECEHEVTALRAWAGDAAVQVLDHDETRHALLLEHCNPGTHLAAEGADVSLDVLIGLMPRVWLPASGPYGTLAAEAASWETCLEAGWRSAGRPCGRRLVDAALDFIRELSPTQGEQVLVHQDLHAVNVLAAEREPWLVIDPKPLTGEREFALASIVRSFELGHSRDAVFGRLDRVTAELDVDRDRTLAWTVAQTMAWSFNSKYCPYHHQTVGWLLEP